MLARTTSTLFVLFVALSLTGCPDSQGEAATPAQENKAAEAPAAEKAEEPAKEEEKKEDEGGW